MASARRKQRFISRLPFAKRISIADSPAAELHVPAAFRCPISLDLMKDPVTLQTGITYDRRSIETWLETGNLTCPVTKQALKDDDLVPNHSLRRMIQDWCVAHRSLGIERIPTPRIPVTPAQVLELLSGVSFASRRGHHARCRELVGNFKALGKESERNRRCIVSGGGSRVLSACFSELATEACEKSRAALMEDILSALTVFFPLDQNSCHQLGSHKSVDFIVSVLQSGDLDARLNAVLVLKELVSSLPPERIDVLAKTNGLIEALVKLIEKPISPRSTKAALVAAFHLITSGEKTAARFVEMGIIPTVLEAVVDSERSLCEKALAVLDGTLSCSRGREVAYGHALAVPVLVKKMFRVSEMATEFAVSALWKLCKNEKKEGGGRGRRGECSREAYQVGGFQKLLLLVQVGCNGATKEKVSELLKLLNGYRASLECAETMDFRRLKKSF
ncbi:U-box domain-containing protein 21-like [Canna indica]|uniref:U-box domain-containing protein n=1 Tax=Canna indica TaxID=4628 RepID=A0AAQ3Q115_9LILI|nr:U-box domain-containing protein 21-like [Canna indica]